METMVDLSSEMGEGFALPPLGLDLRVLEDLTLPGSGERWHQRHRMPRLDHEVLPSISSVSLACGLHSGDPVVLRRLIPELKTRGIRIGAHPSYPDMFRFGQVSMRLDTEDIEAIVLYQLGALDGVLRGFGERIQHIKFHGALAFDVAYDEKVGEAVVHALDKFDSRIILVVLAGSLLARYARGRGLRVAEEGYVDRGYDSAGRLVKRDHPGALVTSPDVAAQRVLDMVTKGEVTSVQGDRVPVHAQTFCLHSDTPRAGAIGRAVVSTLREAGVSIRPLADIVR